MLMNLRPHSRNTGPIRNKRGGARPTPKGPKKPKTAEDLDKELDLFMGDVPKDKDAAASMTAVAVVEQEADVEMA
jgi:THO complex subunit 4